MRLHRVIVVVAQLFAFTVVAEPPSVERLRTLYFGHDQYTGNVEASQLQSPTSEQRAWQIIFSANADSAAALTRARDWTKTSPDDPWSWAAVAMTVDEEPAEALAASAKALALAPHDLTILRIRASTLSATGRNDEALSLLNTLPQEEKDQPLLLVARSNATHSLALRAKDDTKIKEALDLLETALTHEPNSADALYAKGLQLLALRRGPEAAVALGKAVSALPTSAPAHQFFWKATLANDQLSSEKKQEEIRSDVTRFLSARHNDPAALLQAQSAMELIGDKEGAERLGQQILDSAPSSREAEWVAVKRYRALKKQIDETKGDTTALRKEYVAQLRSFVQRPQHRMESVLADTYVSLFMAESDDPSVSADELLSLVRALSQHDPESNPHFAFGVAPAVLADRGAHLAEAAKIVEEGFKVTARRLERDRPMLTEEEAQREADLYEGFLRDARGWILVRQKKFAAAQKDLDRARALTPTRAEPLYHLGKLYEARGQYDRAEEAYVGAMALRTPFKNPSEGALRALYRKRHGGEAGFDKHLLALKSGEATARKKDVLNTRIAEPVRPPAFSLKSLDGKSISSEELKGKVVVIHFWGLWCAKCLPEIPHYQQLADRYKNNDAVRVLTIDNDQDNDRLKKWMTERKYDFMTLLDNGYVGTMAGVQAFPTTWFLDRQGRIAFLKQGASENLVEEFAWRIEALE